ncbi:MAG: hypothetical protein ABSF09_04410 [Candidatus Bathyarchaeia archaeon]
MWRGRLFTVLLLLTIVGLTTQLIYSEAAVTYQATTSRALTTSSSTASVTSSSKASLTSTSSKTSAATSIASAMTTIASPIDSTLNDLPVLKTKYPKLFNPNNTYVEFASVDLSTNPKSDGPPVTFRNVTVTHHYVSGMLIPNGVEWALTRVPPNVVVFILADYGSQVTSTSLSSSVTTFLVTPRNDAYPHVYLFLVNTA